MVDEKLMTSVRYQSEKQKEDFQKKIVGKTTARFVFTDAVEAYRATGETAGRLLIQRNEARKEIKQLKIALLVAQTIAGDLPEEVEK